MIKAIKLPSYIMRRTIRTITTEETWPLRHKVLWPNQDFDAVKLPMDDSGKHLGLFVGDNLMSVISLFEQGEKTQFRKFATDTAFQGLGYGTSLLQHVMDKELSPVCQLFWCNARVSQQGFYQRFGLSTTEKTFTKEGIDFVIMGKRI